MRHTVYLGESPSDEPCEQLGPKYDKSKALLECRALINQMTRLHPPVNDLCRYRVTTSQHDFGSYHSVEAIAVTCDDEENLTEDMEAAVKWTFEAENLFPENWDEPARRELAEKGYVFATYCETCHNMKHGPNNCPYRLQISANKDQPLLAGEFLKLLAPIGGTVEIEHTADTFSIRIEDTVLFLAEMYNSVWQITWPTHLITTPPIPIEQPIHGFVTPTNESVEEPIYLICRRIKYPSILQRPTITQYYETHGPTPGWTAMNHVADRFTRADIDKIIDIIFDLVHAPDFDQATTCIFPQRIHPSCLE